MLPGFIFFYFRLYIYILTPWREKISADISFSNSSLSFYLWPLCMFHADQLFCSLTFSRSSLFLATIKVGLYWVFSPSPPNIRQPLNLLTQFGFSIFRNHLIWAYFSIIAFKLLSEVMTCFLTCSAECVIWKIWSLQLLAQGQPRGNVFPPKLRKFLCAQFRQKDRGWGDKDTVINQCFKSKLFKYKKTFLLYP